MSSQTDMIIPATSFSPSTDISYTKPRVNKAGGKAIGITNKASSRQLYISMPLMLTWGMNERTDESTGRVSYDMSLQFPSEEYATEQTKAALESINAMEEQIKKDAVVNSKEWFNKAKLTDAQVDVLFNPMLYWPKDKDSGERREGASPTLRVKLDYWDDVFKCEIYDVDKKTLYPNSDPSITPVELIAKGCNVATIIKCGGVYFVNGKFGVTWRLHQALVKPKASITGKCFISLSAAETSQLNVQKDEESGEENVEVVESEDEDAGDKPTGGAAEDTESKPSDVEEQDDKKPTKKRIVRRTKD